MSVTRRIVPVVAGMLLSACGTDQSTLPLSPNALLAGNGVESLVNGSYSANVGATTPLIADYVLSAKVHNGATSGNFTFFAENAAGTIDFAADVICIGVDEPLKRAWIGGVITRNSSTRPGFEGGNVIHQVGHHIWFRVADRSPGGSDDADRTTSLGFEGSGGIATSPAYCAAKPWANDGVAVVSGNVTIH